MREGIGMNQTESEEFNIRGFSSVVRTPSCHAGALGSGRVAPANLLRGTISRRDQKLSLCGGKASRGSLPLIRTTLRLDRTPTSQSSKHSRFRSAIGTL